MKKQFIMITLSILVLTCTFTIGVKASEYILSSDEVAYGDVSVKEVLDQLIEVAQTNSVKFNLIEETTISTTSYTSKVLNSETKFVNLVFKDKNGISLMSRMVPKEEFNNYLSSTSYVNLKFVLQSGTQVSGKAYFSVSDDEYTIYGMLTTSGYTLTIYEYN